MADAQVRALMALARATAGDSASAMAKSLAAWFGSPAAINASQLPPNLIAELVALGISRRAARKAGALALSVRLTGRSRYGSPAPYAGMPLTRRVASEEPGLRARYVIAAARRLTEDDSDAAVKREQNYLAMHVAAGRRRRAAAALVDVVASKSGPWLVFRTQHDDRVDGQCAALDGRIFNIDSPPDGKIPGAVHPRCRCYATAWGGAPLRT
jgi:SPP1 gp7 family putative phage head morphogenesis protein